MRMANNGNPLRICELIELLQAVGNPEAVVRMTDGDRECRVVNLETSSTRNVVYLKTMFTPVHWITKQDLSVGVLVGNQLREGDIPL